MGIVIIGGLLFSLGLTLFIIPALYTYLSSEKSHIEVSEAQAMEPESPQSL
jgi:Cu/Ag efflux pump CusA